MESISLDNILPRNIWCYLIKTIKWNTGTAAKRFRQDYINGEKLQHALGWKGSSDFGPKPIKKKQKKNKSSSSQAGGPAHKEPGSKR